MYSNKNKLNSKKKKKTGFLNHVKRTLRVGLDTIYFAENWKHCSKIIFKYVNSVVWPIFNEIFGEKEICGSREQCTRPTGKDRNTFLKKKKKSQNADVETQTQYPNGYLAYFLPAYFIIQLIFATIYESHCTFWYYLWVPPYYFS